MLAESERARFIAETLGERAAKVVPTLMQRIVARHDPKDSSGHMEQIFQVNTCWLVVRIGPSAFPDVAPYLSHPSADVRTMSRGIVGAWGTNASVIPYLSERLKSLLDDEEEDDLWRLMVVVGNPPEPAARYFSERLYYASNDLTHIASDLIALGPPAVPYLAAVIASPNKNARETIVGIFADRFPVVAEGRTSSSEDAARARVDMGLDILEQAMETGPEVRINFLGSLAEWIRRENFVETHNSELRRFVELYCNDPDPRVAVLATKAAADLPNRVGEPTPSEK